MGKRIISLFLIVILVISTSIHVFAAPFDVPLVTLTEQERAYFSLLKSLRVLTAPGTQPYAYEDTGVSLDILEHLCKSAGVTLEVIEAESYADALTRLENGESELSAVKISLSVTLSIGGVSASLELLFQSLFEVADATLYRVKKEGRNFFRIIYQTEETNRPSMGVTE